MNIITFNYIYHSSARKTARELFTKYGHSETQIRDLIVHSSEGYIFYKIKLIHDGQPVEYIIMDDGSIMPYMMSF